MGEFIWEEVSIFIEAAWQGMFIAVFYDALRIFRRVIRHNDIAVNIEDYIFWVIVGLAVFSMIFQNNDGAVRGYIFAALLAGAYTYHKSVSSFLVRYISKILNFILTLLLKKPLKWAKMMLGRILRLLGKPFKGLGSLIKNRVKKGEKKHGKHHDKCNQPKADCHKEVEGYGKHYDKRNQPKADCHKEVEEYGKHYDKKKKKRKARDIRD